MNSLLFGLLGSLLMSGARAKCPAGHDVVKRQISMQPVPPQALQEGPPEWPAIIQPVPLLPPSKNLNDRLQEIGKSVQDFESDANRKAAEILAPRQLLVLPQNHPAARLAEFNKPLPGSPSPEEAYKLESLTASLIKTLPLTELNRLFLSENCSDKVDRPPEGLPTKLQNENGVQEYKQSLLWNQTAMDLLKTTFPCILNKYRTLNGTCNNPVWMKRGSRNSVFRRILPPDYADGISEPRERVSGEFLPSSKSVSTTVVGKNEHENPNYTSLVMHFGQFLAHDLTLTNSNSTQSAPGIKPGCTLGHREQSNLLSSYIDGGQIYGTEKSWARALRSFKNGSLRSATDEEAGNHYTLLPPSCERPSDRHCPFFAGDHRVNVQPGLQTMHTIFMRHHNNLAAKLQTLNPTWDDETLFQEVRAIVIAQLQHITYNEWLPVLLGHETMQQQGIALLQSRERYQLYDINLDATLTNEFATAAFRVGHTLIQKWLGRLAGNGSWVMGIGQFRLKDSFDNTSIVYGNMAADEIAFWLTQSAGKKIENQVVEDVHGNLFGDQDFSLIHLNIAQGRNHGLQSYLKYREVCRLRTAKTFDALREFLYPGAAEKMQEVYKDVMDIDLYVGGISEKPLPGSVVGPTFTCILADQFRRLRAGDRFWYENDLPLPSRLTDEQLYEIRKTSMAGIMCDTNLLLNKGDGMLQKRVFETVTSDTNPLVSCNKIPRTDLRAWKEGANSNPQYAP